MSLNLYVLNVLCATLFQDVLPLQCDVKSQIFIKNDRHFGYFPVKS